MQVLTLNMGKKCILRSAVEKSNNCGVLSAINRVFTVLQKAIRERLLSYYISASCMVHSRRDRKAVLCRP
jgi:hypothetical protein